MTSKKFHKREIAQCNQIEDKGGFDTHWLGWGHDGEQPLVDPIPPFEVRPINLKDEAAEREGEMRWTRWSGQIKTCHIKGGVKLSHVKSFQLMAGHHESCQVGRKISQDRSVKSSQVKMIHEPAGGAEVNGDGAHVFWDKRSFLMKELQRRK